MSYFQRWYFEQTHAKRESVKRLVKAGQLSFAGGSWVMHDEAAAHYVAMVDQTTLGHRFLKEELGFLPKVGWQIDPFGHSNTHASLISSESGFDALYFGRIDYQDRQIRKDDRTLEFVWKGSASNPDQEVFTGVFSDGNYQPPPGFCFDDVMCSDQPVMDDPRLEDGNMDDVIARFVAAIEQEREWAAKGSRNIMFKMGSDMNYMNAHSWYKNIDKIIAEMAARPELAEKYNVFYSHPQRYTEYRAREHREWTLKTDDFFPYSDCAHCFWGGYFTSRPTGKLLERQASQFLQTTKQLGAMSLLPDGKHLLPNLQVLFRLTAADGLLNHHDALTGTEKQHVADDYMKIVSKALTNAEADVARLVLERFAPGAGRDSGADSGLLVCRTARNESLCSASQGYKPGDVFTVLAYNPLARPQKHQQLTVLLGGDYAASVTPIQQPKDDQDGLSKARALAAQVAPVPAVPNPVPGRAPFALVFTAPPLPALGVTGFRVTLKEKTAAALTDGFVSSSSSSSSSSENQENQKSSSNSIESDKVRVTFDLDSGLMSSVERLDLEEPCKARVSNDISYFKSYGAHSLEARQARVALGGAEELPADPRSPTEQNAFPHARSVGRKDVNGRDGPSDQPSGAYIFRPSTSAEQPTPIRDDEAHVVKLTFEHGPQVSTATQHFSDWATQTVRVRKGSAEVEVEWAVGAIPLDDGWGKEVFSSFSSSLKSRGTVYTDANGREFQKRQRNQRPTWDLEVYEEVAGNVYPLTAAAYIRDEDAGLQLSVLPDRAEAGLSQHDGSLSVMVHRRLVEDDWRGVGEALDETTGGMTPYPDPQRVGGGITVSGTVRLLLSPAKSALRELRVAMDKVFLPPQLFYGSAAIANYVNAVPLAVLGEDLPVNINLLTLERWDESTILLRLSHQFAVGEDPQLSAAVDVSLARLLQHFGSLKHVEEVTLSANQNRAEMLRNKIKWKSSAPTDSARETEEADAVATAQRLARGEYTVRLGPMDVKTFLVSL
jgi:hypothetical protein